MTCVLRNSVEEGRGPGDHWVSVLQELFGDVYRRDTILLCSEGRRGWFSVWFVAPIGGTDTSTLSLFIQKKGETGLNKYTQIPQADMFRLKHKDVTEVFRRTGGTWPTLITYETKVTVVYYRESFPVLRYSSIVPRVTLHPRPNVCAHVYHPSCCTSSILRPELRKKKKLCKTRKLVKLMIEGHTNKRSRQCCFIVADTPNDRMLKLSYVQTLVPHSSWPMQTSERGSEHPPKFFIVHFNWLLDKG